MSGTYTKGPWSVKKGFTSGELDIVPCFDGPPEFGDWAEVCTVKDYHDDPQTNARLIAAAPELLEALKHARSQIQHPDQMIDDAIAKATGEKP